MLRDRAIARKVGAQVVQIPFAEVVRPPLNMWREVTIQCLVAAVAITTSLLVSRMVKVFHIYRKMKSFQVSVSRGLLP